MIALEPGVFYNLSFQGNITEPYKVRFPRGTFLLELWGASGGGPYGGLGGYAAGKLVLKRTRTLYLYIGGEGKTTGAVNNCIEGGWNGGGKACSGAYQCSGGGATDIRLTENDNYDERIIVAGGGGGAAGSNSLIEEKYVAGYGGGEEGGTANGSSGTQHKDFGELYATGGTQETFGTAVIMACTFTNENGTIGKGGACAGCYNYCGGGGGGYFGGAGGVDVTGGGGGSGYFNPHYITNGVLKNGNENGKKGNGEVRILTLRVPVCAQISRGRKSPLSISFLLIFVISS